MSTSDGPADTRMMAIVHEALKRDLRRARAVLPRIPRRSAGSRWRWAGT